MEKTTLSGPLPRQAAAGGPLVVSTANPRYFTIRSDKTGLNNDAEHRVVYLTSSHIWNNFHDGMGPGSECAETPEASTTALTWISQKPRPQLHSVVALGTV